MARTAPSIPFDVLIPRRVSWGEEKGWVLRFVPCTPEIGGDFAPWTCSHNKRGTAFLAPNFFAVVTSVCGRNRLRRHLSGLGLSSESSHRPSGMGTRLSFRAVAALDRSRIFNLTTAVTPRFLRLFFRKREGERETGSPPVWYATYAVGRVELMPRSKRARRRIGGAVIH